MRAIEYDGCVIAQTKEAKAVLDIRMARPWSELEAEAKTHGVVVFSSNYELYAELSNASWQRYANLRRGKRCTPSTNRSWK